MFLEGIVVFFLKLNTGAVRCAPAFHLSLQHINLNDAVQVVLMILNITPVNFVISS